MATIARANDRDGRRKPRLSLLSRLDGDQDLVDAVLDLSPSACARFALTCSETMIDSCGRFNMVSSRGQGVLSKPTTLPRKSHATMPVVMPMNTHIDRRPGSPRRRSYRADSCRACAWKARAWLVVLGEITGAAGVAGCGFPFVSVTKSFPGGELKAAYVRDSQVGDLCCETWI